MIHLNFFMNKDLSSNQHEANESLNDCQSATDVNDETASESDEILTLSSNCPSPELFHDEVTEGLNQLALQLPVPTLEKGPWCSVSYYEFNECLGEPREVTPFTLDIDGFSVSTGDPGRICLGLVQNPNRKSLVTETRRGIGDGLRMIKEYNPYDGNLTIKIKCLGINPIFVEAGCFNVSRGYGLRTICKVPQECELTVFNMKDFLHFLECLQTTNACGCSYLAMSDFLCRVRVSFVKGWGQEYRRRDIHQLPCWVQMDFLKPRKILENEMKHGSAQWKFNFTDAMEKMKSLRSKISHA